MVAAARAVEQGGADFIVLCTNTMHKDAGSIQQNTHIPFLHIADATGERIRQADLQTVGLLGTRFTMEEDFYRDRLIEKYGLDVIIPQVKERETIHRVIYEELVLGKINPASREEYKRIIEAMIEQGAEGIILGCTEIGLLIHPEDCRVPLFDTTRIHAEAAVEYALAG
jgi:aspartate racemase